MLIWDYIRDFLVQYIFGGADSSGNIYSNSLGYCYGDWDDFVGSNQLVFNVGLVDNGHLADAPIPFYVSLSDWLATTTTIIIMCLIVVLFAMLVRWVFKTVVSAFLLR